MIQLYDQDARDLAGLLALIADLIEAQTITTADRNNRDGIIGRIERWKPEQTSQTLDDSPFEAYAIGDRLRVIRRAIVEQLRTPADGKVLNDR